MDRHQQEMWQRMLARIEDFRAGAISLHRLVDDLRGLYVEADPHDSRVRDDFEEYWSALEIELAQRSEPWMPPGVATDESLRLAAGEFEWWVKQVLDESVLGEHGLARRCADSPSAPTRDNAPTRQRGSGGR